MTRHQIVQEAEHARCARHSAAPGEPCACDPPRVCLARITSRTGVRGRIRQPDLASVIDDGLEETHGVGFVLDPGAAA